MVFLGNRLKFGVQLGGNKGEHILPATEEHLARSIIGTGLPLVEALECILLGPLGITFVGFEEGRVKEEEEGPEQSWGIFALLRLGNKSGKT